MLNKKNYTRVYAIIVIGFAVIAVFFLASLFYTYTPDFSQLNQLNSITANDVSIVDPNISIEYSLTIEKLEISVPIVMNVDATNEDDYAQALEQGVAQMKGTAKPDEVGNMVIFGHSSQTIGATGKYGKVFTKLNDLKTGDEIKIINNDGQKEIVYQVREKKIIMPEETSVINPTDKTQLTLLTCWPIGSDQKRLAVFADLKD